MTRRQVGQPERYSSGKGDLPDIRFPLNTLQELSRLQRHSVDWYTRMWSRYEPGLDIDLARLIRLKPFAYLYRRCEAACK